VAGTGIDSASFDATRNFREVSRTAFREDSLRRTKPVTCKEMGKISAYLAGQSTRISMCAPTGSGFLHLKLNPEALISHVIPEPALTSEPFCETR
jgi:hypothetical protein